METSNPADTTSANIPERTRPTPADVPLARILPTPPTAASATTDSIAALGFVSVPLLVALDVADPRRWIAGTKGGDPRRADFDFFVVDGERRVGDLRAELAGVEGATVHALTLPASTSPETVAALRLALNLARKSNPYREAEAVETLSAGGMLDAEIAGLIGVTRPTVSKRRKLLTLPALIRAGLAAGTVGPSIAYRLANMPERFHADAVRVLAANGRVTGDDLRDMTRAKRTEEVGRLPDDLFAMPAGYDADAGRGTASGAASALASIGINPKSLRRAASALRSRAGEHEAHGRAVAKQDPPDAERATKAAARDRSDAAALDTLAAGGESDDQRERPGIDVELGAEDVADLRASADVLERRGNPAALRRADLLRRIADAADAARDLSAGIGG